MNIIPYFLIWLEICLMEIWIVHPMKILYVKCLAFMHTSHLQWIKLFRIAFDKYVDIKSGCFFSLHDDWSLFSFMLLLLMIHRMQLCVCIHVQMVLQVLWIIFIQSHNKILKLLINVKWNHMQMEIVYFVFVQYVDHDE